MAYTRWPRPGESVLLEIQDRATPLVAVVEEVDDLRLVVREPYDPAGSTVDQPPPGSRLVLRWDNDAGRHACEGLLAGIHLDRVPLWQVPLEGPPVVEQRRAHVRVPDALPVELHAAGRTDRAVVCDVSEGGARCVVEQRPSVEPGEELTLRMVLEGRTAEAPGVLLESLVLGDGRTQLRVRFRHLGTAAAPLRRHVMAQQYRARAVRG